MTTILLSGGGGSNNWLPLMLVPLAAILILKGAQSLIQFIKRKRTHHHSNIDDMPFTKQMPFHDN